MPPGDAPASRPPVLLLLKGPPGVGKSTLAAALARALGWPLVDKDDARSSFQALAPEHPGIDWNELSYAVMWRVAGTQLRCGLSAIVDCPLARRPLFDRAVALAEQHGAQLALVELHARDQQAWAQRIEQRGAVDRGTEHEHKPGNWSEVQAIQARNGGSEAWSAAAGVRLHCTLDSTALSTQQLEEAVLAWLAGTGLLATTARRGGGGA